MIFRKKAQSEVITTVLIILLVLAATFIVYTAVKSMITKGTETASSRTDCFGTSLSIVSANTATENVTITRDPGGTEKNITNIKLLVEGANVQYTLQSGKVTLGALETVVLNVNAGISTGNKIKAAAVIGDGTVCDPSAEFTA